MSRGPAPWAKFCRRLRIRGGGPDAAGATKRRSARIGYGDDGGLPKDSDRIDNQTRRWAMEGGKWTFSASVAAAAAIDA